MVRLVRLQEPVAAALLAAGKVIARFDGRMEYGPRALGHRSILYHAKEPAVNQWLNQRLGRTEFMPFAPATLYEHREACYQHMAGCEHAATFMTITFDCTEEMKRTSPAAVHVDGTARPQLVTAESNPSFHRILRMTALAQQTAQDDSRMRSISFLHNLRAGRLGYLNLSIHHNIGQRRAGCFIDDDFINPSRCIDVKTRRHFAIAERAFGRRVFCNFAVKRAEKFAFGHNRRSGSCGSWRWRAR